MMVNKAVSITVLAGILLILSPSGVTQAFSGTGSGTEQDPYIITNVAQLQEMKDDLDACYELGNDVDASGTNSWNNGEGFEPIQFFTGSFDGKRHRITDLYINIPSRSGFGLFGSPYGTIKNVGLINADITGVVEIGGLAGLNSGTITNCFSTGSVNGERFNVGGLVGFNFGTITNCYSAGIVRSVNGTTLVGGLVGANFYGGTITNCYSTASVVGNYCVGGLVGGNNYTITNCFSAGLVRGSSTGGLVGCNVTYGTETDCFWDIQTSEQTTSDGGTGKTTSEMKQQATFTNWDFETIWDIVEGETYPFLRGVGGEEPPVVCTATIDFEPDTLNLKSRGNWITCYIELSEGYDVDDIDVGSILLEYLLEVQHSDVQDDMLMVKFDRQDVIAYIELALEIELPADVTLMVTGELTDGTPFEGSDTIRIIDEGVEG